MKKPNKKGGSKMNILYIQKQLQPSRLSKLNYFVSIKKNLDEEIVSKLRQHIIYDNTFEEILLEITYMIKDETNTELNRLHNEFIKFLDDYNKINVDDTEIIIDNDVMTNLVLKITEYIKAEKRYASGDVEQQLIKLEETIDKYDLDDVPLGKNFIDAVSKLLESSNVNPVATLPNTSNTNPVATLPNMSNTNTVATLPNTSNANPVFNKPTTVTNTTKNNTIERNQLKKQYRIAKKYLERIKDTNLLNVYKNAKRAALEKKKLNGTNKKKLNATIESIITSNASIQRYKTDIEDALDTLEKTYNNYSKLYMNTSIDSDAADYLRDERKYIDEQKAIFKKEFEKEIYIPTSNTLPVTQKSNEEKIDNAIKNAEVVVKDAKDIESNTNTVLNANQIAKRVTNEESSQIALDIMLQLNKLAGSSTITSFQFNVFKTTFNNVKKEYEMKKEKMLKVDIDNIDNEIKRINKKIEKIEKLFKQKRNEAKTKKIANEAKRKVNEEEAKRKVNEEAKRVANEAEAKRKVNEEKIKANEERVKAEENARLKAERKAKYPLNKFRTFMSQYTPQKYENLNNNNKPTYKQALDNLKRLKKIKENKTILNENKFTPDNMIKRYEKSYKIYEDVLARQKQAELNYIQRKNPDLVTESKTESKKIRIGLPPVKRNTLPPPILITPPKPPPKAFKKTYAQGHQTQKQNRTVQGGKRYAKTIKKK